MAGPIILGYDGSDCAKAALDQTIILAGALQADVVVAFGYASNPMGGETQDEELAIRGMGEALASEAVTKLQAAGIDTSVELVHDRPAQSILRVADEHAAILIVVGNHGESPMLGAILGSVPHKLLHRATVPVLVVPAKD